MNVSCPQCFLEFVAIVVIVVVVNFWLLIPTLVMSLLFYLIRYGFINTSRSVKRVESISKFDENFNNLIILLTFDNFSAKSNLFTYKCNFARLVNDSSFQRLRHSAK